MAAADEAHELRRRNQGLVDDLQSTEENLQRGADGLERGIAEHQWSRLPISSAAGRPVKTAQDRFHRMTLPYRLSTNVGAACWSSVARQRLGDFVHRGRVRSERRLHPKLRA